jgi:hypothetical protein
VGRRRRRRRTMGRRKRRRRMRTGSLRRVVRRGSKGVQSDVICRLTSPASRSYGMTAAERPNGSG